jgi:hypothetical protein
MQKVQIRIWISNLYQAIEIKSGSAVHPDFFKNLLIYQKLSGIADDQLFLINGGMDTYRRNQAMVVSWKDLEILILGE